MLWLHFCFIVYPLKMFHSVSHFCFFSFSSLILCSYFSFLSNHISAMISVSAPVPFLFNLCSVFTHTLFTPHCHHSKHAFFCCQCPITTTRFKARGIVLDIIRTKELLQSYILLQNQHRFDDIR